MILGRRKELHPVLLQQREGRRERLPTEHNCVLSEADTNKLKTRQVLGAGAPFLKISHNRISVVNFVPLLLSATG